MWYSSLLPEYQSYSNNTVHYCPSTTSSTNMTQSASVPVPIFWYNAVNLHKYQSYWYDTLHYSPSISPTDRTQSTTELVPVLPIWNSLLLPQYQTYWYYSPLLPKYQLRGLPTVPYCPKSKSLLLTYNPLLPRTCPNKLQHFCLSISSADMIFSPLLSQYQSCWSDTVHFYPSPRPTDTSPLLSQISSTDTLNFTTAQVPVLLMPYNQLLPQYQSNWYDSIHYCSTTNPIFKLQYTTAPAPILLIRHSPLLPKY